MFYCAPRPFFSFKMNEFEFGVTRVDGRVAHCYISDNTQSVCVHLKTDSWPVLLGKLSPISAIAVLLINLVVKFDRGLVCMSIDLSAVFLYCCGAVRLLSWRLLNSLYIILLSLYVAGVEVLLMYECQQLRWNVLISVLFQYTLFAKIGHFQCVLVIVWQPGL